MTIPIRSMPDLVAALCSRRDEIEITHAAIEDIGLLPDRYVTKLLHGEKNIGAKTLSGLLEGVDCHLELKPNAISGRRFRERFTKRKRAPTDPRWVAQADAQAVEMERRKLRENQRIWGQMGAKARMKRLSKRKRRLIAKTAALARWAKAASKNLNR
jgi:hypothetical protein